MTLSPELEEQIKVFDKNRNFKNSEPEHVELAEQERQKFVNSFPRNKIRGIKIDNYVPGKDPLDTNTFAYLNEFGSPNFGNNTGGSASKFGVFVIRNGDRKGEYTWAGNEEWRKGDNVSGYETVEEAYRNAISIIADSVDAAEDCKKSNDWERLARIIEEKVETPKYTPTLLIITKTIAMYFPNDFPYSWGYQHLHLVLDLFGINREDMADRGNFYLKLQRLINFKNKHPVIKNWTNRYLAEFTSPYWKSRERGKEAESQPNDPSEFEKIKRFCLEELPSPKRNYREIAIKLMLEDSKFSATWKKIGDTVKLLNYEIGKWKEYSAGYEAQAEEMNKEYLVEQFKISKRDTETRSYSLFLSQTIEQEKIKELQKLTGRAIAKWHKKMKGDDFNLYYCSPGKSKNNHEFLDEFKKSGTIGLHYAVTDDLSNYTPKEVKNKYPESADNLCQLKSIKPGDIVICNNGKRGIYDFGIATSEYFFEVEKVGTPATYPHRVKVEWLHVGPLLEEEHYYHSANQGCDLIHEHKDKFMSILLGEKSESHNYYVITQNPGSKYNDIVGKQYEFPLHIKNAKRFVGGTNFVIQTKIDGTYNFVGYGKVREVKAKNETDENGKQITMCIATYSKYTKFDEPKLRTEELNSKMLWIAFPNKGKGQPLDSMLEIKPEFYREIIGEDLIDDDQLLDTLNLESYIQALKWIPNLILYGPPGTGKTFHAKEIAKKLTSSNKSNRSFEHILTGTLHQPADIRQISDDEYKDFVVDSIKNEAEEQDYTFTEINTYDQYSLEKDGQKIHIKIYYSASTKEDPDDLYVGISQTNIDFLKQVPEDNRFIIIVNHSCKNFVVLPYSIEQKQKAEFSNSTDGNWDPTGVNAHSFHIEIDANKVNFKRAGYDCKKFMRNINMIFSNETIIPVTFHPSFSYEDFIEGFRPDVNPSTSSQYVLEDGIFKTACNIAKTNRDKKIVVIIDEINRGNIPKIFGELISLIENDKRGPNNTLKLVYSKENFFVPANLYIIGTMNTADKSLVQMDEALRRRFAFEELMPQPELLDKQYQELQVPKSDADTYKDILLKLNDTIIDTGERMRQYRDKQIGHSYFWNIKNDNDLRLVIKYQIIPLLQDYFYDDYAEIKRILGDEIIREDNRQSELLDKGNEVKLKNALLKALNPSKNTEQEKSTKDTEKEEEDADK